MSSGVVIDASALVDLFLAGRRGAAVDARIDGLDLHAPAHLDAEALSAFGRLHRGGALSATKVAGILVELADASIERHELPLLLAGAWAHRNRIRLYDAFYVALAEQLEVPLITTDARLGRAAKVAEVVTG